MKTVTKSIYTAADIAVPELIKGEICVSLNSDKHNVYLISEKSIYPEKREFYQELKTVLEPNSTVVHSTKKYKIFKYNNFLSFEWARTISQANSKVIWINKADFLLLNKFVK